MTEAGFQDWKSGDAGPPGTACPLSRRILLFSPPSVGLADRLESGVADWTGEESPVFLLSVSVPAGLFLLLLLPFPPVPTRKSMENPILGRATDGGPVGVDGLFDSGVAARGIMLPSFHQVYSIRIQHKHNTAQV